MEWRRERHRPAGLPGRRRRAPASSRRQPRPGPRRQRRAAPSRPRASSPRNRVQAAPVLWSARSSPAAHCAAVVLNSGGANACTGPEGFDDTHATAEKVAEVLGCGRRRGRGLLHRAHRRAPADRQARSPGSTTRAAALAVDAAAADAATAVHHHRHRRQAAGRERGDGWTVGGFGKGAGMMAPSLATMLVVVTTDADVDAATARRRPARRDRRDLRPPRHRRLVLHQRHRAAARLRRRGRHPGAGRVRRRGHRPSAPSSPGSCRPTPRASPSEIVVTVDGRPRRRRGAGRRPRGRPRQPGQDRAVRLGPQLGPDRRGGRRERGAASSPRRSRHRQRGAALPGRRRGRRPRARPTCPAPTSPSRSTSDSARGRRRCCTTDLSHAYVEENSAYST